MAKKNFIRGRVLLTPRCQEFFDPAVVERGREYYRGGRVRFEATGVRELRGTVEGGASYNVSLSWNEEGTRYCLTCDCPRYLSGEFCKHTWALLLSAEGNGQRYLCGPGLRLLHSPTHDGGGARPELAPGGSSAGWRRQLRALGKVTEKTEPAKLAAEGARRASFALADSSEKEDGPALSLLLQEQRKDGSWGAYQTGSITLADLPHFGDPLDRELLPTLMLHGAYEDPHGSRGFGFGVTNFTGLTLAPELADPVLLRLAAAGRLVQENAKAGGQRRYLPFALAEGPWELTVRLEEKAGLYYPRSTLRRGNDEILLERGFAAVTPSLMRQGECLYPLRHKARPDWLEAAGTLLPFPPSDADEWIELFYLSARAALSLPPGLGWREETGQPKPIAECTAESGAGEGFLRCHIYFSYGATKVPANSGRTGVADRAARRLYLRDEAAEAAYLKPTGEGAILLRAEVFAAWAEERLKEGWKISVDQKNLRAPQEVRARVSSGIDWFELRPGISFAAEEANAEAILSALRSRSAYVTLGDGSLGLLPGQWLERMQKLVDWEDGSARETLRFRRGRGPLLAAMLTQELACESDAEFGALLSEVAYGRAPSPGKADPGFGGTLRAYQEAGLGWLRYLARIGCGGILADDMGLGKTVQVLARLHEEYRRGAAGPSLIVVPKSLLFNWQDEARRFAPGLSVTVHTAAARQRAASRTFGHDIVLVTYAMLRQDIEFFTSREFHYFVADEAQAIKNPDSQTYKACLQIRARHRLAMSGTPVENSGADLMALVEFATPGLLGKTLRQKLKAARAGGDGDDLRLLTRALRPFILRRTKQQVLPELPAKTEQTILIELTPPERRRYDALAKHFRAQVGEAIAGGGFGGSQMLILQALLRLRQAACHGGMIDEAGKGEESAKLSMLVEDLAQLAAEGHRALVFSQFTKLLDFTGEALNKSGISYERLDGSTPSEARRAAVERFQAPGGSSVFLISLKAGGVGLNLTAASYVFLLDPWWNPAAEAQAIDRCHRIGQTSAVTAYRFIAKDTVEEKVLELQKDKRALADSLLGEETKVLSRLTAEEVMALLD